jgi:hypothetical protein
MTWQAENQQQATQQPDKQPNEAVEPPIYGWLLAAAACTALCLYIGETAYYHDAATCREKEGAL